MLTNSAFGCVIAISLWIVVPDCCDAHFQPNNLQQAYQQQYHTAPQYAPVPNVAQPAPVQYVPAQQMAAQQHNMPAQPAAAMPSHAASAHHHPPPTSGNILHDQNRIHDKEHIKEHLGGVFSEPDLSKMSEEELQFHYFKMHDADNNNMLDGSELIKSLIHWHVEESKTLGANAPPAGTTKIFTDTELANMIDPILEVDDKNKDGFIDYPEFIAAQRTRGF